jgi:GTP cyclohydrolase II
VYLRGHEGRGIGLVAKIATYELQEGGWDTVTANEFLGFPVDARNYAIAADILKTLSFTKIRLLSNNEAKSRALQTCGITVTEMVPLEAGVNQHNMRYLETKRDSLGHLLSL